MSFKHQGKQSCRRPGGKAYHSNYEGAYINYVSEALGFETTVSWGPRPKKIFSGFGNALKSLQKKGATACPRLEHSVSIHKRKFSIDIEPGNAERVLREERHGDNIDELLRAHDKQTFSQQIFPT